MKTITAAVAACWLVVGGMMVLSAVVSHENPQSMLLLRGVLGVAAILGAVGTLRRSLHGWWVLTSTNGVVVAMWARGIARTYGMHREKIEAVQDMLSAMIIVFLAVCLVVLLADRPSRWRAPVLSTEADG